MAKEEIGNLIPTYIPGYSDDADIQAALRVYHYGDYDYSPSNTSPASLVSPSMAKTIYDIQQDILSLDASTVQNSIFTAKGQILTATTSNTPTVLPLGTNYQFLIAKSDETTGLLWTNTLTAPSVSTPTISGGITLTGSTTGSTIIQASSTASGTITFPAVTGTVVTTGDTGTVTGTMIASDTIVNADINSAAAIAYSKLNLSNSIVNADINTSAAIDKTKISGTAITAADTGTVTSTMIADNTIVNGDISTTAAIAYSKLNLSGSIVNSDVSTSAAIAISKLAASTISGVSLGSNLNSLTISTGLSGTSYNGSSAVTIAIDSSVATTSGAQTLTNKTFTDNVTTFQDNTDTTKKMQFELSGLTTATTRTLTVPNTSGTIITTGDSGTVTNTMLAGSIANTKLANSTISGVSLGSNLNSLTISTGLSGTSYNGSSAITIAIDSTVATTSGSQTLTNKTFTDSTTNFQDNTDTSKKMQFELSGITTATTRTLTVPNNSGTIALTSDLSSYAALSGATFTGSVLFPAATTSATSIRVPHGSAPTTPTNGDIWTTTAGLYARINGSTVGPFGTGTGNGTVTSVATGTGLSGGTITTTGTISLSAASATVIGGLHGYTNTTVTNTALGYQALNANTTGTNNTAIGYQALSSNQGGTQSVAIGYQALTSNINGGENVAIGYQALDVNTGTSNTAVGHSALGGNTTGFYNVAIGWGALKGSTTANGSTAVGTSALQLGTTGINTAVGYNALLSTTASENVALGYQAADANTSGAYNTVIGHNALRAVTTGDSNTAIGRESGGAVTGSQNTIIGRNAANSGTNNLTTGSNNILIGYNAAASAATVSNEITLGNASITRFRIPGLSIDWTGNPFNSPTITTPIITMANTSPAFTTNNYDLVLSDQYKIVLASNGTTAGTVKIPTNSIAYPTGTQITIVQTGTGQITITAGTPATTTINSTGATATSPKLRTQYSSATCIKTAGEQWLVVGDIV